MSTKQKLYKHAFSASLKAAPTKVVDGKTLHALPILPASPFRPVNDARSGIEFSYEAEALIAQYEASGRRLPLDVEHNTERGGDTRSRGWSVALTTAEREPDAGLEPGTLYGWFELNSLGTEEIGDKQYGYTSGVAIGSWLEENRMQFLRLKSLALTNNPATHMPMTFSAEEAEDEFFSSTPVEPSYTEKQTFSDQTMKELIELLQLSADADDAAIVAAVTALTADKTSLSADVATFTATAAETTTQLTAAQEQVTTLTSQLETVTTELSQLKAAAVDKTATDAVDAAITARKITPAQRESMLSFARADLTAFNAAMGAAQPLISDAPTQAPAGLDEATTQLSADDNEFLKAFGFKAESLMKAKQQLAE